MSNPVYNVLIPIYANFNALDVGGPLDVLCNYAGRYPDGSSPFKITIAAKDDKAANSRAYEFMTVQPDVTFEKVISDIEAGRYDILLVPGCGPDAATAAKKIPSPNIVDVCSAFRASDNKSGLPKYMVSICTGALIMAETGCFDGLDCTTHWGPLADLKKICEAQGNPAKSVTRKRWVDGGFAKPVAGAKVKTRVVSSGGISCGLDCCLYLVKQLFGTQKAIDTAAMMDYVWNGGIEEVFTPSFSAIDKGVLSQQWTTQQYPR